LRSNRSSSRGRTTERGFALVWAVGLALLFFMLVSLVLIDSARELAEARRFRSRIIANVLAENGAELAAEQLLTRTSFLPVNHEDWQGSIRGDVQKTEDGNFTAWGEGEARGETPARARVEVTGSILGSRILIHFTVHEP
jgi:hypothetical protein